MREGFEVTAGHEEDSNDNVDPESAGGSWQVGDGGVAKTGFVSLDVPHGKVDRQDDSHADHSDDEDKDNHVSLEPEKKLRKMIGRDEADLMYWMASMPHFLRIMSSERVKILVTQEHIPRSTSENSPPTIESVSFSAEATNPPEENSF